MNNYEFVKFLGQGSYGEVQLVKHTLEEKEYVLKKIGLHGASQKERFSAEQEAALLSKLKHINIVSYKQSYQQDGFLCIVMQHCEGGDLHTWLHGRGGRLLEESQIVLWFVQIALALQYLHGKNILHRDLKTQNIFLTHKNEIVKLGDLGIARQLSNTHEMARTIIGTPYYMSPELFSNKPYNFKSDVWSLGCVVFEMCTMRHPFKARDFSGLAYKICTGKVPPLPDRYTAELGCLVASMLEQEAEDRPSVSEILQLKFIRSYIQVFINRNRNVKTRVESEGAGNKKEVPHIRSNRDQHSDQQSRRLSNSHHLSLVPSVVDFVKKGELKAEQEEPVTMSNARKRRIEDKRRRTKSRDSPDTFSSSSDSHSVGSARSASPGSQDCFAPPADQPVKLPPSKPVILPAKSNKPPSPVLVRRVPTALPLRSTSPVRHKPPSPTSCTAKPPSPTPCTARSTCRATTKPPSPTPCRATAKPPSPTPCRATTKPPSPTPFKSRPPSPVQRERTGSSPQRPDSPIPSHVRASPVPTRPRGRSSPIPISQRPPSPSQTKTPVAKRADQSERKVSRPKYRPLPPTPPSAKSERRRTKSQADVDILDDSITHDTPVRDDGPARPLPPSPEDTPQTSRLKSRLEKLRSQVLPCVSRDVLDRAYRVLDESDPEKVQSQLLLLIGNTQPGLTNKVTELFICEQTLKNKLFQSI